MHYGRRHSFAKSHVSTDPYLYFPHFRQFAILNFGIYRPLWFSAFQLFLCFLVLAKKLKGLFICNDQRQEAFLLTHLESIQVNKKFFE